MKRIIKKWSLKERSRGTSYMDVRHDARKRKKEV